VRVYALRSSLLCEGRTTNYCLAADVRGFAASSAARSLSWRTKRQCNKLHHMPLCVKAARGPCRHIDT
jgi:hypothetical protein